MGKHKGTGKAGQVGKVADKNAMIALPSGKMVKLKNAPTGFMVSGAHYLQCCEGMGKFNPYDGQMEDGVGYGRRANNLPEKLWVSQNHGTPLLRAHHFLRSFQTAPSSSGSTRTRSIAIPSVFNTMS